MSKMFKGDSEMIDSIRHIFTRAFFPIPNSIHPTSVLCRFCVDG
jgi:hypothetical protein